MNQITGTIQNIFSDRPLQEDEYRNESDNLIHCAKCKTPRQHHVVVLGKEMVVPIRCRCQQEVQDKEEADASKPNDTVSRRKIYEDNDMLYDGKKVNNIIVNTVTTKQDRNPNSGLITYKNYARGKTKWRYLTPRECFKLMGFDESDFDRVISYNPQIAKNRKLYSTEKLIKLAGNSIVVDVLEAIFRQIMDINTEILGERE